MFAYKSKRDIPISPKLGILCPEIRMNPSSKCKMWQYTSKKTYFRPIAMK
jgi:hypothetical protein